MRVRNPALVVAVAVIAAAALPASLLAAAPGVAQPRPGPSARGRVQLDRVVAVVNDEVVLASELRRATDRHPMLREAMSQLPAGAPASQVQQTRREVESAVLDELIHIVLVRGEAEKLDIKVSEPELQTALANIAANNNLTVEALKKQVEASDEFDSWQEYTGELRDQIMSLRVSQQLATWSVSEAQIREYYRKMTKDERAKVEVEQFAFLPKGEAQADRDRAFAAAQAAGRRLREGTTAEALATELGRDESQWKRTIARGDIAPVLEDAVFAAKPGEVVGPIASGQGYVVYRVVAQVEAAALGYEEAKERIREQLENEAYFKAEQELRQQLRAKAHVDVRL